jgi:hypothetical protein
MHTFLESHRQTKSGLASTLLSGIFILGLALAPPGGGTVHPLDQSGLTTCLPGMVWDTKHQKCLVRHSRMLPDPELTK